MKVIKLDGSEQRFLPNKIHKRIKTHAKGLKINADEIFKKTVAGVVDGMDTTSIDELIARTAVEDIIVHPDYSDFAARIIVTRQAKRIGVEPKPEDFMFDYKGIRKFLMLYSERDDNGMPTELPSMSYRRICNFLGNGEKEISEFYDALSTQKISLATPIRVNAGSNGMKSLISCEITSLIHDSRQGIQDTRQRVEDASSNGAGIGHHIHNLRSAKTMVSSFKANAGGVLRYADMMQSSMRFFKQGKRSGSMALYLGIWHLDVPDFIDMYLPDGDEKKRTRDLFGGICIPDLFMEKLLAGEEWYLFCPHQVKQAGFKALHETWGEEFKEVYNQLVEAGLGTRTNPENLYKKIIKAQIKGGKPYIFFWDNVNNNYQQRYLGVCTGSNLCSEYIGFSKPGMSSQCCLGLVNMLRIEDMGEVRYYTKVLTKILNRVIDNNIWSHDWAKEGGTSQRTIGIGVAGLADYFHKNKMDYVDMLAHEELFRNIYESALEESSRLAREEGLYFEGWDISPYNKGGHQGDIEFKNLPVANSLLIAPMPSASTSLLLGANESFEPFFENIYQRSVSGSQYVVVNRWLVQELEELGLWSKDMAKKIISNEGSIQDIDEIPISIKERYKTVWEHSQKDMIDMAVARQKYIDQAQSFNIYYSNPTYGKVASAIKYAWEKGLKTIYYSRSKSALDKASRLTDKSSTTKKYDNGLEISCFGCSS